MTRNRILLAKHQKEFFWKTVEVVWKLILPDLIRDINRACTGDLLPGLTFILDIYPDQIFDRKKRRNMEIDRLESAGKDFYDRVYKGYHKIAEIDPIRVKLIDAAKSIDQIKSDIWEFVTQKINSTY